MKNKAILVVLVLVVLAIAGGFIYWQNQKQVEQQETESSASLGSEIYESTQNPVKDKIPETNPFEEAKINPFAE